MKILYITTIGPTMNFFKAFIKELTEGGNTVDLACNEELGAISDFYKDLGCREYHLDCSRSPFDKGNITCIKQIRKLVEDNHYDIVHCHTPIAAACTRLACRNLRGKTVLDAEGSEHSLRVFYTAHGFHFYKGAPKKNWIIYYPVEWLCAHYTDKLITINKEDYELAKKKFSCGGRCRVEYVPGMGVDVDRFANTNVDRREKRKELGVPEDALFFVSAGEINANKNHEVMIRALAKVNNPNYCYLIAGVGELEDYLNNLIKELKQEKNIRLIGFRRDLPEIYKAADVCVFPSIREGLGLAALEGMAAGLPLICADNRGTRDYAVDNENAFTVQQNDIDGYINAIDRASHLDAEQSEKFGKNGQRMSLHFCNEKSLEVMRGIYDIV